MTKNYTVSSFNTFSHALFALSFSPSLHLFPLFLCTLAASLPYLQLFCFFPIISFSPLLLGFPINSKTVFLLIFWRDAIVSEGLFLLYNIFRHAFYTQSYEFTASPTPLHASHHWKFHLSHAVCFSVSILVFPYIYNYSMNGLENCFDLMQTKGNPKSNKYTTHFHAHNRRNGVVVREAFINDCVPFHEFHLFSSLLFFFIFSVLKDDGAFSPFLSPSYSAISHTRFFLFSLRPRRLFCIKRSRLSRRWYKEMYTFHCYRCLHVFLLLYFRS